MSMLLDLNRSTLGFQGVLANRQSYVYVSTLGA